MTSRAGVTLVEILVALVVAAVGVLALVGADTDAWRHHRRADSQVAGALLAHSRVEWLASLACNGTTSGTARWAGDVEERWTVSVGARDLRVFTAAATWPATAGRDSAIVEGSRWCE